MRPFLADFDIGQIVFVLVAGVIGVVNWLINLLKEKKEAAGRSSHIPTEEEAEARYRAWEEQTRPVTPPDASPAPGGGMLHDLMGELRKALEPTHEHRTPPRPPRLPDAEPAATALPLAPQHSDVGSAPSNVPTLQTLRADREPHPLTALLRTEGGYRQAFVLREVLGPPRGLQEYAGPD